MDYPYSAEIELASNLHPSLSKGFGDAETLWTEYLLMDYKVAMSPIQQLLLLQSLLYPLNCEEIDLKPDLLPSLSEASKSPGKIEQRLLWFD